MVLQDPLYTLYRLELTGSCSPLLHLLKARPKIYFKGVEVKPLMKRNRNYWCHSLCLTLSSYLGFGYLSSLTLSYTSISGDSWYICGFDSVFWLLLRRQWQWQCMTDDGWFKTQQITYVECHLLNSTGQRLTRKKKRNPLHHLSLNFCLVLFDKCWKRRRRVEVEPINNQIYCFVCWIDELIWRNIKEQLVNHLLGSSKW